MCVGLTRPSADPHLAPPFGVRNGRTGERKPQGKPKGGPSVAGGDLSSFSHLSLFVFLSFLFFFNRTIVSSFLCIDVSVKCFFYHFSCSLSLCSLSRPLPLCLGVRGDTVKFTAYNSSFTKQPSSNTLTQTTSILFKSNAWSLFRFYTWASFFSK